MRSCGRAGAKLLTSTVPRTQWRGLWTMRSAVNSFHVPMQSSPAALLRPFSTATPPPEEGNPDAKANPEVEQQEPKDNAEPQPEKGEEEVEAEEKTASEEDLSHEELLAEFRKLKEAKGEADEEVKSLKNKLAYALADIDNVRKISKKDVANAREFALKGFGKDLLDVIDNCERALGIFPEECKEKGHQMSGIYTGIEMTSNVMMKVFDKHGLCKIDIVPKETAFDPNLHDALFQQPVEGLDAGVVFSVVKNGWTINGRVLRAAQVGVSSDPE
uniref:GrpE protein homolog n=1 Tax=Eutreptiella gymnastica TaxID=73025 RepID=A0A7S4GFL7_9EUGL